VEAKLYKINKGSHDSANFNSGSFARMQHMHFQAVFNETAIYEVDEADAGDENKLYGFSDCGDHHLRNSARFGWVWNSDKSQLEIYGYTHMYGDHYSKFIGVAELNKPYTYEIKLSGNEYIFRFNGEKITMPRGCDSKNTSVLSYKLGPYFGGTNKAPHDIYIYIDELDADNDEEILPIGIVNIYPNPACEEAYVALENYSDKTEVVKLRVYGLDGKLVLTTDEIIAAPLCTFTQLMIISTLDNGYYMVTVSNSLDEIGLTDDLTVAKKIIKACTKNNDGMRQKLH
jgi:hypothetical protein